MTPFDIDWQARDYIVTFLRSALEPWARIEGSELGESQQKLIEALGYDDEINLGLMLLLDRSIRSMIQSDWFLERLGEERPPYDYYTQGMKDARSIFERIKHTAIARCKQFQGQYGGKEAEAWINAYEPI